MSPASRVESHNSVVWLRTGVSSGNWPTNILKSRKYRAHHLKARMLGVSGTPVSDAVGKLRDLGDRPGDKDKNSNLFGLGFLQYVSFLGWLVMPSRFRSMCSLLTVPCD